jgi:hypothetical protein
MIGCGLERPKQAPETMLAGEKHCSQVTWISGPPDTALQTTTI